MCFPCSIYEDVYFESRPKPRRAHQHPHTGTIYAAYHAPRPMAPVPLTRVVPLSLGTPVAPSMRPMLLPVDSTGAPAMNPYPGYPTLLPFPGPAQGRYAQGNSRVSYGWSGYQNAWPLNQRTQQEAMIEAGCDNNPQDMAPSDPDPWRFYKVKELNGHFTRRNRDTIDSGAIGKVRWYQTPQGVFYAKVIADSKA